MPTVADRHYGQVNIPPWVSDLNSFRRWVHSGGLPEKLPAHYLRDDVWLDLSMEELFSHNLVKTAILVGWAKVVDEAKDGLIVGDRTLLTNDDARLATEPDAMYISYRSCEAKRVSFVSGDSTDGDATEINGTPDIVIEVVSPNSEDKDNEWLMDAYWRAGIPEYWLIDARDEDELRFTIYKHKADGYDATRKTGGWAKSGVLGRSFRLTRKTGRHGYPRYTLENR
jgi:Uma2 family endonuclease